MLDFFQIATKEVRGGKIEIRPDFTVGRSKDLMVRGQSFYALWDEERNLWTTDEFEVVRLVDEQLNEFAEQMKADGADCSVKPLSKFGNGGWAQFRKYMKNISDNAHQLDTKLTFANTEVKKTDYVSRRLPYSLAPGNHDAWDELLDFLYGGKERAKIEWSIGSVVSGDSKKLEKFLVLYGPGGTGKSTILKIVEKLFGDYVKMFEAKALVGNNNSFATEAFKTNPLVAIQHDGDLSKIEDNTKLNSIIGHDKMLINEKYKPGHEMKMQAFLFMGTNKPVKITDAKSGIIRRLIDAKPTGKKFEPDHYYTLMTRIDFELGAIAHHCLDVYRSMGKNFYSLYKPIDMMLQTDVFFNFIEAHYDIFKQQDGATLRQAYDLYKQFVLDAGLEFKLTQIKFREELKNYFENFDDRIMVDGMQMRSYYSGFTAMPFKQPVEPVTKPPSFSLVMDEDMSIFDAQMAAQPAQYGNRQENPKLYWTDEERDIDGVMQKPKPSQVVTTVLSDLDTSKLHFVKVPENHIVIDFDLKGDDGNKSLERNLEAASSWPPTYAELSKSGGGVHLHYLYDGDPSELASVYSEGIEIKAYTGNSSLRRKLSKCNSVPVSSINSGLPFKEKKVLQQKTLQSERGLRDLIARNLRKEIHPGTKPSIDFISAILDDAYKSGMQYDVSDLRQRITVFANNSSNQPLVCLKIVQKMKFKAEESADTIKLTSLTDDAPLAFFDVEVYPNLFVICWKYAGAPSTVAMINPSAQEVEALFKLKLVGFNNRPYDNHMLWGAYMGMTVEQLYKLSQDIIVNKNRNAMFGEAYSLSYADIYDFTTKKQTLKKYEIDLGIHHMEMNLPWTEPVPKDMWDEVVKYCINDVVATEETFNSRKQDFVARQILADLSGLTVNDPTRKHAAKILFGNDRNPSEHFVYTDLSLEFPGYTYDQFATGDKSSYRGELVGEGGFVYAEPGIYENVALLDVASMHPTSLVKLNLFGKYTEKFANLMRARLAIKKGDYDLFVELLPGVGAPVSTDDAKALADALKLIINSIYGYTAATFDNPFRDKRNIDNIVAKRGALFMIDLKFALQERGIKVVHIKTDSVKIPDITPEAVDFIIAFGAKYGYEFEYEATYNKFCLANDAVYIARTDEQDPPGAYERKWTAVGSQFQHPYVFKSLFSGEPLTFKDLCETKSVIQGSMYLSYGEEENENRNFVGRVGRFVPVTEKMNGGRLIRVKEDRDFAVTGTKGYSWLEAEMIEQLNEPAVERMLFEDLSDAEEGTGSIVDIIDMSYFMALAEAAIETIEEFGSFKEFVK
jgi:Family of unknown function (DUF5906)